MKYLYIRATSYDGQKTVNKNNNEKPVHAAIFFYLNVSLID